MTEQGYKNRLSKQVVRIVLPKRYEDNASRDYNALITRVVLLD